MEGVGFGSGTGQDEASVARADVKGELGSAADAAEIGGGEFPARLSCDDEHGRLFSCAARQ
jgi:hypothetical protein